LPLPESAIDEANERTETAPEYHPSTGYANSVDENMDGIDKVDGDDEVRHFDGGVDEEDQVQHLKGDFFGQYTEEDFEWPDDHGVEGDKDVDESSDEEVFDGTIGWEPLTARYLLLPFLMYLMLTSKSKNCTRMKLTIKIHATLQKLD
jgi:hypothetical protein